MSDANAPAADWYPDPSGRFQFRYWDGEAWTGHVSTDGKTDWDPPGEAPAQEQASAQQESQEAGQPAAEPSTAQDAGEAAAEPPETAGGEAAAGDSAWAPQASQPAPAEQAAQPAPAGQLAVEPAAQAQPAGQPAAQTLTEDEPSDTNLVANRRAGVADDVVAWLDEVAGQVEPRLSRIDKGWTAQQQAEAARACAYGLLVGHLAHMHPHMRPELSQVAESHPSFTTLQEGARLDTLEQIATDPQRAAAWLGPLIGTEDVDRIRMLFD